MPTGRRKSHTYTPDVVDDIHYKAAIGRPRIRGYGALGMPLAFTDLTFLPANLSRLVIDSYREPCFTDVKLGRRFARRPLELSIPIMVAGMGYGSISKPARMAIAKATAALETAYCTGEGGMIPNEREMAHKLIYQIGPGHLGVNIKDIKKADAIELLLDTANHGIGRYLYAEKLIPEVAEVWGVPPEIDFYAPATHMDFDDPESLALKVEELREATDWEIPIGIKVGGRMDEMINIALACDIDLIMIDGIQAGTPAGPDVVVENVGLPTLAALSQAIMTLRKLGKEEDVDVVVMGGIREGGDIAKCLALGARAVSIGTAALVAMGCQSCMLCPTGRCPAGITTHDPELAARFNVDQAAENLTNFLTALTAEVQMVARSCGKTRVQNLEPEDMRSLSILTSATTRVALAGSNKIY
ncbi:MAG: FMN-binding glutamate synthase family protein [Chloroflexi bacterium]|nr:FMN-binding glutamate synthase family protein [Chloroflexota bacterium]